MKVQLECMYCGHKWVEEVYNKSSIDSKTCTKGNCGDSNLIVRDLNASKIDAYKGCPPFPEPKKRTGWFMGMDTSEQVYMRIS